MLRRKPKCPLCSRRDKVFLNYDSKTTAGKKWFCYRDSLYFDRR